MSRSHSAMRKETESPSADAPHWDAEAHCLYWRGELIKHFKHEAPCQEAILAEFQANNWPHFLTMELPKEEGVNPKERLRQTIKNLNRSCGKRLHFSQEGNGSRVVWSAPD